MKRMLLMLVMVLVMACTVFAEDLAELVIGKWVDGTDVLEFYGQSIGRDVTDTTYYKYTFPSSDQIVMDKGAGETEQYTIAVSATTLTLTPLEAGQADTNSTQTVYTKESWDLSPCTINLRQLDGAMVLFTMDHEGVPPVGIYDLTPTYLAEFPVCPEGGIYLLSSPPQCNIPGHGLGE